MWHGPQIIRALSHDADGESVDGRLEVRLLGIDHQADASFFCMSRHFDDSLFHVEETMLLLVAEVLHQRLNHSALQVQNLKDKRHLERTRGRCLEDVLELSWIVEELLPSLDIDKAVVVKLQNGDQTLCCSVLDNTAFLKISRFTLAKNSECLEKFNPVSTASTLTVCRNCSSLRCDVTSLLYGIPVIALKKSAEWLIESESFRSREGRPASSSLVLRALVLQLLPRALSNFRWDNTEERFVVHLSPIRPEHSCPLPWRKLFCS